jgi:hypothetical protein
VKHIRSKAQFSHEGMPKKLGSGFDQYLPCSADIHISSGVKLLTTFDSAHRRQWKSRAAVKLEHPRSLCSTAASTFPPNDTDPLDRDDG